MEEVLKVEDLTFDYSDVSVLRKVNFTLYAGDFLGIIGSNGAGKSTLIRLILGLLPCEKGKITVFGKDISEVRGLVGYVPQKANAFNSAFPATVREAVMSNLYPKTGLFRRYGKKFEPELANVLKITGLEGLENKLIGKLSGGQQQKVFIARALIAGPKLLLMDEPTTGIDAASAESIMQLIRKLNKDGMTIIMTNHDTASLINAAGKLLIFCSHGYEEFLNRSDLSLDDVNNILAGKRGHHHE